jgi:hypothetical protein
MIMLMMIVMSRLIIMLRTTFLVVFALSFGVVYVTSSTSATHGVHLELDEPWPTDGVAKFVSFGDWGIVNEAQQAVAASMAQTAADIGATFVLNLADNCMYIICS